MQRLFSNRDLHKLIIPIIIEQFLLILVGLVDSVMVSSAGEAAVSAVSLIDTIMILLINAFSALAIGGAVVAGQALGRKSSEEGCDTTEQLVLFSTVASIVIMGLLYLGKGFILTTVFGNIEADVMANCNTYLVIVAASIPFIALYNAGAAIYRAMGDSKTPMILSAIMNTMNVVGNAILIYGFKMGVAGAAIPTMLSRVFAGICMLVLLCNRKKVLHVRSLWKIRLHWDVLKRILKIGIPYGLENSMFQLGKVMVLSLVSGFGTSSIAANAVCNSVCSFAILTGMSMGYTLSAVTAQCVGAGDYEQVRFYTRKLLKYAYVSMWMMNIFILIILPVIMKVYNLTPETIEIAKKIVWYHAVCACTFWVPSFTLPNTLRAANDAAYCMWISIASMWIFRIGFSYVLGAYLGMGVFGVWVAMTIDWLVRAAFFIWRYRGNKWQYRTV